MVVGGGPAEAGTAESPRAAPAPSEAPTPPRPRPAVPPPSRRGAAFPAQPWGSSARLRPLGGIGGLKPVKAPWTAKILAGRCRGLLIVQGPKPRHESKFLCLFKTLTYQSGVICLFLPSFLALQGQFQFHLGCFRGREPTVINNRKNCKWKHGKVFILFPTLVLGWSSCVGAEHKGAYSRGHARSRSAGRREGFRAFCSETPHLALSPSPTLH